MKPTQNKFLFTRVGVDVANRKDAVGLCGIGLGVDRQLLSLHS
ncbi:MAG: hypothetical protein RIT13_1262, partial [Pseudomonadota bacterium]